MNLWDSPNDLHWQESIREAKRANTQLFVGKIVDTNNDGNYQANILQQYSVRVMGWGTVVPNCKVASNQAGYNGTGHYTAYQKGDAVICMAKEGAMDDLIILGSVRLNGNHEEFIEKGQGLKPGDLVKSARGGALANQASLHPSRVTKPDSEFYLMGNNNIKSEYEDPTFAQSNEDIADMQSLIGIVQSRGRGGVITNYAYGGIINYTDGNNIIVSGGTSENKCTRMLKAAKRHAEIAKMLSTITGKEVDTESIFNENTNTLKDNNVSDSTLGIVNAEFGDINNTELGINNVDIKDSADLVKSLLDGTVRPQQEEKNESVSERLTSFIDTTAQTAKEVINNINPFNKSAAPPLFRQEEHLKLAKSLVELAKQCNTEAAAMQQQAGVMTDAFGNHVGTAAQPGVTDSTSDPNQSTANVNENNVGVRNVASGDKPPVRKVPAHSRNFTKGRPTKITEIVIHNTVFTFQKSIDLFASSTNKNKTSAHYLISRQGEIVQMVEDEDKAHHAYQANGRSIGIEHEAVADLDAKGNITKVISSGFTPALEASSISLIKYLMKQYSIKPENIVPHRHEVKKTECPGLIFPKDSDFYSWRKKNFGA